jgi:hypothetical protein
VGILTQLATASISLTVLSSGRRCPLFPGFKVDFPHGTGAPVTTAAGPLAMLLTMVRCGCNAHCGNRNRSLLADVSN